MEIIIPNWRTPKNIKALTTTRNFGCSINEFASNNFGLHINDNTEHVLKNRINLAKEHNLPSEPIWLNQTHSNICVVVEDNFPNINADAAITKDSRFPLVIMTADCVPILICHKLGTEIGAIHAGWKGLLNGVIENTFTNLSDRPENYIAWIGPAICQNCYQTGKEVMSEFMIKFSDSIKFFKTTNTNINANLPGIAEYILNNLGVKKIYQSNECTFEKTNKFYSYRKSAKTGRMASLIWFQDGIK
ncbi:MAG: polyphenol oxidase [Legionellales bacterium RIFCSPHIGHO2_12_FULL_35_11]|nr:MAG: polyphenol oxidase [Legionellales bacterium RIFCSPHIGHO2_12_FULL_35_11]